MRFWDGLPDWTAWAFTGTMGVCWFVAIWHKDWFIMALATYWFTIGAAVLLDMYEDPALRGIGD